MTDVSSIVEQLRQLNAILEEQNKIAQIMNQTMQGVKEEFARENALLEEMNRLRVEEMKLRMAK